jgi:hypothetical protein
MRLSCSLMAFMSTDIFYNFGPGFGKRNVLMMYPRSSVDPSNNRARVQDIRTEIVYTTGVLDCATDKKKRSSTAFPLSRLFTDIRSFTRCAWS